MPWLLLERIPLFIKLCFWINNLLRLHGVMMHGEDASVIGLFYSQGLLLGIVLATLGQKESESFELLVGIVLGLLGCSAKLP